MGSDCQTIYRKASPAAILLEEYLMLTGSLLLVAASVGLCNIVCGAEPFEAFLTKHCIRCHGPQKEEGDIRIDRLSRDFKSGVDTHHWAEALDKVNSGAMPPKKEPQPTQAEISAFVTSLDVLAPGDPDLLAWIADAQIGRAHV